MGSEVVLLGSFARGDAGEESDVDVLVDFSESVSLLGVARLERVISEDIGRDVDIVTENGFSPRILERFQEREVIA
ncbi:MAG: nucleotidyltransferase family protein [Candidatus Nanohalobium sp.]